jgi:hypothetical protein
MPPGASHSENTTIQSTRARPRPTLRTVIIEPRSVRPVAGTSRPGGLERDAPKASRGPPTKFNGPQRGLFASPLAASATTPQPRAWSASASSRRKRLVSACSEPRSDKASCVGRNCVVAPRPRAGRSGVPRRAPHRTAARIAPRRRAARAAWPYLGALAATVRLSSSRSSRIVSQAASISRTARLTSGAPLAWSSAAATSRRDRSMSSDLAGPCANALAGRSS